MLDGVSFGHDAILALFPGFPQVPVSRGGPPSRPSTASKQGSRAVSPAGSYDRFAGPASLMGPWWGNGWVVSQVPGGTMQG